MFKRDVIGEEEILLEMDKHLRRNAFIEDTRNTNQRIEAIELLQIAANNFESIGRIKEAEAVTRIIEFVATPKQQVENIKETGTQWPKESFPTDDDTTEEEDALFKEYIESGLGDEDEKLDDSEFVALKKLWD